MDTGPGTVPAGRYIFSLEKTSNRGLFFVSQIVIAFSTFAGMEIEEPVTDCTIIYKYLDWIPGTTGKKQYYEDKFKTIASLKDYFTRYPSAGALVGYGKAHAGNRWAFEAVLMLQWNGRPPVEFINVFAFVRFLEEHPALARAVEYVPKKRH